MTIVVQSGCFLSMASRCEDACREGYEFPYAKVVQRGVDIRLRSKDFGWRRKVEENKSLDKNRVYKPHLKRTSKPI